MTGVHSIAVCLLIAGASVASAQTNLSDAQRLEQQGRYGEATRAYAQQLEREPANIVALSGLERVLTRLGRLDSVAPFVAQALAGDPHNEMIREVEFRVAAQVYGADSVAVVVQRWTTALPESPAPYRQWAFWLKQEGDLKRAMQVLEVGRARLRDDRLVEYVAQLLIASGDWLAAAREWFRAAQRDESLLPSAASGLWQAPRELHADLLDVLLGDGTAPLGRHLAAELLVRWDRPEEGWTLLDSALPPDDASAIVLLRRFADRTRQQRTPAGARARGYALERLAGYLAGSEASRTRLAAAGAFASAGELGAAERLLNRLPGGPVEPQSDQAAAMATLIRVLADAGRVAEAEDRLREWEPVLSGDDLLEIRELLAWVWVKQGELDRAEEVLEGEGTVGAEALRGWIALYRGDLETARSRFRAAGPAAQSREEATRRSGMLVLLERVPIMHLPPLGDALLLLVRGDTARAVTGLREVAHALAPLGGRADVLGFAGELALRRGDYGVAEPLLLEAIAADSAGPAAPAVRYTLAVVYVELGGTDRAVSQLEDLILGYPESALVPQARRLLDELNGMIPKS